MGTLGEIITAIGLFFGYLSLLFIYYFMMFFTWLKNSWEMLLAQIAQISIVVAVGLLLVTVFFLLRRWIKAQSELQKTGFDKKDVPKTSAKGNNYCSRFLAIFLLMESIYTGYATYGMFQMIHLITTGEVSEDLVGIKPDLWILIPLIAQVVLVVHGALSLFGQKSVAVLSLGMAMMMSLIVVGYYFNNNIHYIGGALIYITITRVLPLAYTIFLLRKGKLT